MRDNSDMARQTQAAESTIRQIAVPQAETDIFATAEYEEIVTLWSLRRRRKLAELKTVIDFGAPRMAVVQESSLCLLIAAGFAGPVNAYDFKGNVLWSRSDLAGVQQLMPIPNGPEPMVGIGLEGQPYVVLSAIDGREVSRLNDIRKLYGTRSTASILGITRKSAVCLAALASTVLWEEPLKSFAVLHGALSSRQATYCEAAGSVYCFDLDGTRKWILHPDRDHHFFRVGWNHVTGQWMAIDWDYEKGSSKRLHAINETGNAAFVADLGEPAETEFFASGDLLVTSNGDIVDAQSGQIVWTFLKK
jgi:hypothetical protein